MTAQEYREMFTGNAARAAPQGKISGKTRKFPAKRKPKVPRDANPAAILSRLMKIVELGRLTLQPEERLAVDFADSLRDLTNKGLLPAVWLHPANEIAGRRSSLSKIRYTIAKRMGLLPGAADYLFLWADGSGCLEAKIGSNKQQDNQLDFEWWCKENGVRYAVFRTVEEGHAILREWGVLKTP